MKYVLTALVSLLWASLAMAAEPAGAAGHLLRRPAAESRTVPEVQAEPLPQ